MFKNGSIFVLANDSKIFRLVVDNNTQKSICQLFSNATASLVNGKTCHAYEVNYKPEDDEILQVENFLLPDEIKDAIRLEFRFSKRIPKLKETKKLTGIRFRKSRQFSSENAFRIMRVNIFKSLFKNIGKSKT